MEAVSKTAASSADRVLEALATLSGLLDRTMMEVKALDNEFQDRMTRAVREAEEILRGEMSAQIEKAVHEATSSLQSEMTQMLASQFEGEQKKAIESLRSQYETELERANSELTKTSEAMAIIEMERARLAEELERLQSEAQTAAAESAAALAAATAAATANAKSAGSASADMQVVEAELATAQTKLKEIMNIIEDPATELSVVIRKNVERSDLEAYLRGIRFAASHAGTNGNGSK